jgi:glycerol-3-phosphate acyltransferase PlsY
VALWVASFLAVATGVETGLLAKYWAALFCLLGHMFPVMFGFKGGKGILSGGTIALMIDWRIALVVWGGFLILVALTRYVSLGSVWAGGSFPFICWYCFGNPVIVVLGFLCGGLVVWQHRGNIVRLVQGNERKLSFRKKKEG